MAHPTHILLGLLASLAPGALASCAYGTHLHPRAEGEIEAPTFGYIGAQGPVNWHSLDTANEACATGSSQSPIDMVSSSFTVVPGSELNITIPDFEEGAEFENLGSTVEVIAEAGTLSVSDVEYTLKQFHFHLPSEHLDNGTSMAMEMHMVWESAESAIAVVGVYIDIAEGATTESTVKSRYNKYSKNTRRGVGQAQRRAEFQETEAVATAATPSDLLETILGSVDQIPELGDTLTTSALAMTDLVDLLTAASFQSYSGSLTTPPCTEGVSWFVSTQKLAIQASTFVKARNVIGFNSRFPQNSLGETNVITLAEESM